MFLKSLCFQCLIIGQILGLSQVALQENSSPERLSVDLSKTKVENDQQKKLTTKVQPIDESSFLKSVYKAQKNSSFLEYQFTQSGWPIIDFFKIADSISLDVWYGAFRAISNSTRSCLYIRSCALNNLLAASEVYLVPYLEKFKAMDDNSILEGKISKILKQRLFDNKTQSMENLTTSLSKEIVELCEKQKSEPIGQYVCMVKELYYNFIDSAITRTTWEPTDYSTAWDSLLTTANYLYQMPSIIETYDKLDNLITSLVHSFGRFVEFNYQSLPLSFLENIKASIEQKEAFFLSESEADDFVVPKKEFLLKKINDCIDKKRPQEPKAWQENNQIITMNQIIKPGNTEKLFENV